MPKDSLEQFFRNIASHRRHGVEHMPTWKREDVHYHEMHIWTGLVGDNIAVGKLEQLLLV